MDFKTINKNGIFFQQIYWCASNMNGYELSCTKNLCTSKGNGNFVHNLLSRVLKILNFIVCQEACSQSSETSVC